MKGEWQVHILLLIWWTDIWRFCSNKRWSSTQLLWTWSGPKTLKWSIKSPCYRVWGDFVPAPPPFSLNRILAHLLSMWIITLTKLTRLVQAFIKTVLFYCNTTLDLIPSPAPQPQKPWHQFSLLKENEEWSLEMTKLRKVWYEAFWFLHKSVSAKNQGC